MLINISCVRKVCDELGVRYSVLDDNSNLIRIESNRPVYFVNNASPLNPEDIVRVCQDKEFRVVVYKKKIMFIYLKNNRKAKFVGNLSPLHWEGARAELVNV